MRAIVLIGAVLALAACGIDGPPSQPSGGIDRTNEGGVGVAGSL